MHSRSMELMVIDHRRANGLFLNAGWLMLLLSLIMCSTLATRTSSSPSTSSDGDDKPMGSPDANNYGSGTANYSGSGDRGVKRPTAIFIFGDSLVDVGMNNHLRASIARANYRPNGIDYPGRTPTGRFCNGRLISDFLGEHWGMDPPLAYSDPANTHEKLLLGANFASAGSGILNDTGFIFIQRFPMDKQVQLMGEYVSKLRAMVGDAQASYIVSNALFSITIGANDFLSNYFLIPTSARKLQFTLPQYQDFLITKLRQQIKEIYGYGARNIIIVGLGPIGCMPLLIGQRVLVNANGHCIDSFQQVAINFNKGLTSMTKELQQELPGSVFLFSNAFGMSMDLINNPSDFGFQHVNTACCGRGTRYKSFVPCIPTMNVCEDRESYIFWDPFHPTEHVNKIISQRVLFGPPSDISPINLSQLYS